MVLVNNEWILEKISCMYEKVESKAPAPDSRFLSLLSALSGTDNNPVGGMAIVRFECSVNIVRLWIESNF